LFNQKMPPPRRCCLGHAGPSCYATVPA